MWRNNNRNVAPQAGNIPKVVPIEQLSLLVPYGFYEAKVKFKTIQMNQF